MKKTLVTRLLAILVCVAMLATVTPIFAAAEITITQVDITGVTEPVAGQAINCDFSVENVGLTKAAEGDWFNITDDDWMYDGFLFEAGKQYRFLAYVDVLSGYAWPSRLSGNVTATLNGQAAEIAGVDKKEYYCFYYTFTCAEASTVIDKIEITDADVTPYIGGKVENYLYYTLPDNCHYSMETNLWYNEGTGNYLPGAETAFVSGNTYTHAWNLVAEEGYIFAENATVTVNESSALVDTTWTKRSNDGTMFEVWTLPSLATAPTVIDKIEINGFCDAVVGGKAGDYNHITLPEDAPYQFVPNFPLWNNDTDKVLLDNSDTFETGKSYSLGGWLAANKGYIFAEDAEVLLNGGEYPVDETTTERDESLNYGGYVFYVWSEPKEAVEKPADIEITEITITDADITPIPGEKAGDHLGFALPDDCHFTVNLHYWNNENSGANLDLNDTFAEGTIYDVGWVLKADKGYVFAENATITINGQTDILNDVYTHNYGGDNTIFSVWTKATEAVEKPAGIVIDKIEINDVDLEPVAGEKAGDHLGFALPDDCHYTVSNVRWYYLPIESDGEFCGMNNEDVFETETIYYAEYILLPDEGYVFAKDAAATINGSAERTGEAFFSSDGSFSIFTKQTECVEPTEKLLGDANDDGAVNMKDVLLMRKFLAGMSVTLNEQNADVNGDGDVNMKDVLMLRKYLAGLVETLGA